MTISKDVLQIIARDSVPIVKGKEIEWRDIGKSLEQRLMELSERLGTEKDPQNIVLLVDAIAKLHDVIYH